MKALSIAFVVFAAAAPCSAQEFMRPLEMPAHRALIAQSAGAPLAPFETDGCSGGLSDSWRWVARQFPRVGEFSEEHPPWEYCCVIHDRAYHNAAGADRAGKSFDARRKADEELRNCVEDHGKRHAQDYADRYAMTPEQVQRGHAVTADFLFWAVRFGGAPCSGLPWRWGYGYPDCTVLRGEVPARE